MASITSSNPAATVSFHRKPIFRSILSPNSMSFRLDKSRLRGIKTGTEGSEVVRSNQETASYEADFLKKPLVLSRVVNQHKGKDYSEDKEIEKIGGYGDTWVDWEDQILEDTVPIVGFVRMILHSGKYGSGDRLNPEHEKTVLERLLRYHPECEKKIGCGVDYITIGYHPNFESSRCLFIVRKDGELVDFSYWKCLKGLIKENYPLYADTFILRHFRKRGRS